MSAHDDISMTPSANFDKPDDFEIIGDALIERNIRD